MACKKCTDFIDNSCTSVVPSNCIPWQGDTYDTEDLEICLGDSLTYVTNIILEKIDGILRGEGIHLDSLDFSDCQYIQDLLPDDAKKLLDVLNTYKEAFCIIKEEIEALNTQLNDFTNVEDYTAPCLEVVDPCGDPATFKTLFQSVITKVCDLETYYNSIATSIVDVVEEATGNFIGGGAITTCGGNGYSISGSGASTIFKIEALVPPNCPIIYTGSLTYFDSNGKGLPGSPYCGWYKCNGSNGTPNSSALPQNGSNNIQYIIRFV